MGSKRTNRGVEFQDPETAEKLARQRKTKQDRNCLITVIEKCQTDKMVPFSLAATGVPLKFHKANHLPRLF